MSTRRRARSNRPKDCPYVGKGGLKLEFALDHFGVEVRDRVAGDLGCSTGGFTDCLLQRGATHVYAVDTGYGVLAYKLRIDPRVHLHERTNALHWTAPEPLDLITIDMGWTPQSRALPAATTMLAPEGVVLTLVKPQYEADKALVKRGILPEEHLEPVMEQVRESVDDRLFIVDEALSPIKGNGGNTEVWLELRLRSGE